MLKEYLQGTQKVAISGHVRPDGDCVGSCMGLYLHLQENYREMQVDVYLEEIPESFHFIKDSEVIKHTVEELVDYDVFFALDCGSSDRLGFSEVLLKKAKKTICIDHHISNTGYAMENYIEPNVSSTAELVYQMIEETMVSKDVAECLYLGIVHDTGVFQYTSTKPSTLRCAAVLMEKGVNAARIIQSTFYEKSYNQQRLLGYALVNSKLYLDNRCVGTILTLEDMQQFCTTANDTEGIASILRNTKGAQVAIFLYELITKEQEVSRFKISLRAGSAVDVSKIASYFGGGGHKKAAGFDIEGNVDEIIEKVMNQIKLQLDGE